MPGPDGPWGDALVAAVRAGEVDESVIDEHLRAAAAPRRPGRRARRLNASSPPTCRRRPAPTRREQLTRLAAAGHHGAHQRDGALPLAPGATGGADRPARARDHRHGRRFRAGQPAVPGQRRRGPDAPCSATRSPSPTASRCARGPCRPAPEFVTDPETGEPRHARARCYADRRHGARRRASRQRQGAGGLRRRLPRAGRPGSSSRRRSMRRGAIELGVVGIGDWVVRDRRPGPRVPGGVHVGGLRRRDAGAAVGPSRRGAVTT